jgi:hypothetical protein
MSCTIVRRDFLKCALASAVVIPVLDAADARVTDLQGVRAAFLTGSLVIVFGSHLTQERFL